MYQAFDQLPLAKECDAFYSGHVFICIFFLSFLQHKPCRNECHLAFYIWRYYGLPRQSWCWVYVNFYYFFNCNLCLFCIFSVKSQKENPSYNINKTKMSNIIIITPKHTWGNSKNKAAEEILFIWQLLEKVCQPFLEYYMRRVEKQEGVLYQNNSQFASTFLLIFRLIYTMCDNM